MVVDILGIFVLQKIGSMVGSKVGNKLIDKSLKKLGLRKEKIGNLSVEDYRKIISEVVREEVSDQTIDITHIIEVSQKELKDLFKQGLSSVNERIDKLINTLPALIQESLAPSINAISIDYGSQASNSQLRKSRKMIGENINPTCKDCGHFDKSTSLINLNGLEWKCPVCGVSFELKELSAELLHVTPEQFAKFSGLNLGSTLLASRNSRPLDDSRFVDREEIHELLDDAIIAKEEGNIQPLFILTGSAGYGKTWLLGKYAKKYYEEENISLFFELREGFHASWKSLFGFNYKQSVGAVIKSAEKLDRALLLILDGFDEIPESEQKIVFEFIRDHIESSRNILCVIGSRKVDWNGSKVVQNEIHGIRSKIWTDNPSLGYTYELGEFDSEEIEKACKLYQLPENLEKWKFGLEKHAPYPYWWEPIKNRSEVLGFLPHPVDRYLMASFYNRMLLNPNDQNLLGELVKEILDLNGSIMSEVSIYDLKKQPSAKQLLYWASTGVILYNNSVQTDLRISVKEEIFACHFISLYCYQDREQRYERLDAFMDEVSENQMDFIAPFFAQSEPKLSRFVEWADRLTDPKKREEWMDIVAISGTLYTDTNLENIIIEGKDINPMEGSILLG